MVQALQFEASWSSTQKEEETTSKVGRGHELFRGLQKQETRPKKKNGRGAPEHGRLPHPTEFTTLKEDH